MKELLLISIMINIVCLFKLAEKIQIPGESTFYFGAGVCLAIGFGLYLLVKVIYTIIDELGDRI